MGNLIELTKRQLNQSWEVLSGKNKQLLIIAVSIIVLFAGILFFVMSRQQYVVLFSNLDSQETAEIFTRLQEMDVQPRMEGVSTILVPEEREAEIRMQLTVEGYPRTGFNYDLFMDSGEFGQFGQTDEDKRILVIMQLQERLAQSIKFLDGVEDAVVTIAMPETDQFVLRDQQIPVTASVIIHSTPGHVITSVQAENMERLVAKSVPGLKPENITIIDKNANVLNRQQNEQLTNNQFDLEHQMEDRIRQQVIDLLEPVFGLGRVVSNVNVKINFDTEITESVRFEPVIDDEGIIISREELRERVTDAAPVGIVGETPNITQYPAAADGTAGESDKTHEIVNYEVNEIKERIERQQGRLEDLSISVIIDNEDLDLETIDDVKELVAAAVGTDIARIAVHGMKFDVSLQETLVEGFEERRIGQALFDSNLLIFVVAGVVLLILGGLLMKRNRRSLEEKALRQVAIETGVGQIDGIQQIDLNQDVRDSVKKQLDKLAAQRPDTMAQLLRNWLSEE